MKNNEEIFNEAFFKKQIPKIRKPSDLTDYSPVDPTSAPLVQVTDTDEMKKRLTGLYGAVFGNNNVKNLANRSLKTFPIIVSDNIEPETVVMVKRLLEEQYAEYINLLVSNQVVDLSAYETGNSTGNIALQALDVVSDNDFSKSRLANKAARGQELTADDIFANTPIYSILRENYGEFDCGDEAINELLEDAVIVPSENANDVIRFMLENMEDIVSLTEATPPKPPKHQKSPSGGSFTSVKPEKIIDLLSDSRYVDGSDYKKYVDSLIAQNADSLAAAREKVQRDQDRSDDTLRWNIDRAWNQLVLNDKKENNREADKLRNYDWNKEKFYAQQEYNKDKEERHHQWEIEKSELQRQRDLEDADAKKEKKDGMQDKGADILIDQNKFEEKCQNAVAEFLKEHPVIWEYFKDATFLLESRAISGMEYYNYLVYKLGIPVGDQARQTLVHKYPATSIRTGNEGYKATISKDQAKDIMRNQRSDSVVMNKIIHANVAKALGLGAVAGGTTAAGIKGFISLEAIKTALINAGIWIWTGSLPVFILTGVAAGTAAGYGIAKLIASLKKAKERHNIGSKIPVAGYERVEALITALRRSRANISATIEYDGAVEGDFDKKKAGIYNKPKASSIEYRPIYDSSKKDDSTKTEKNYFSDVYSGVNKQMDELLKNNRVVAESESTETYTFIIDEEANKELENAINETLDELAQDEDYCKEVLTEKWFSKVKPTSVPMTTKYVSSKPDKDILVTPSFMARNPYAYGTVEIDRKVAKERKYNQPLIMTIKFKERFADDKYSDNELTAVIGILGKVVRIPSEEMEQILIENASGKTLDGIFSGKLGNAITDMIKLTKIKPELKSNPQTSDIWHNLERIRALAAANAISGSRNNNISNAHIIFSQKEIDNVRNQTGVDYLKDAKKVSALMRRYSAFTLMTANDASQRFYIFDDPDNTSWDAIPYSALSSKDGSDQLMAALTRMQRTNL